MFNLDSISSSRPVRPPRIIILGEPKSGKSTFSAQANNPIFIPIDKEEGIDEIEVPSFPVCKTVDNVRECLVTLYNESHDFETVVIDSITALEPLIWQEVCKSYKVDSIEKVLGGYGKGYSIALNIWQEIMSGLDYLRSDVKMASIMVGHAKVKKVKHVEGENYDAYGFGINERASSLFERWADSILFTKRKIVTRKEGDGFNTTNKAIVADQGKLVLCTQNTAAHPGGGRGAYGMLPPELPLLWSEYTSAVADAQQLYAQTMANLQSSKE